MVLFVLFFIFVVVVGFVSYFVGQQRIRDIATFAKAHGLTVIGNDWELGDCGFSLFRAGNRPLLAQRAARSSGTAFR